MVAGALSLYGRFLTKWKVPLVAVVHSYSDIVVVDFFLTLKLKLAGTLLRDEPGNYVRTVRTGNG